MSDDDPVQRRDPDEPDAPGDDHDHMAPPKEPCECWCMHCRRTFTSSEMWFQRVIGDPQGFKGFWMCPTPNCGGAGFTFDIFPTDPDHPANAGWVVDDDEDDHDDEAYEEAFFEENGDEALHGVEAADAAWDPEETKWKALDEALGDGAAADLEGEEWKHGLRPGERPPEPDWMQQARLEDEQREREYDEPDRRPRELDWSDRTDRRRREDRSRPGGEWSEDDIPF